MKKIFIVAPYFPPSAKPPAQRVRLLAEHLYKFNWHPVIFTVNPKFREETKDPWMTELVGNEFELVEVNCLDQRKTRKIKVGDLGLRMLPYLFFKLHKYAKKQKPDFILYPVPPWYILMIAPVIKRLTGIPYGIDFIDPWVHELDSTETSGKKRFSQWIAKKMEKKVCENASVIYSVSRGINENLLKRYPSLTNKIFIAVPYGAEPNDFDSVRKQLQIEKHDKVFIRYIGAIWLDCYPVLDGLMPALAAANRSLPLQIEFLGTSYAGEDLSTPQLKKWIVENNMHDYTIEDSVRISYRKAVELTLQSDVLLLIGGMQPYYAASKLMGLLVSKKTFVAFLHEDSFPAKLLKELNFPYLVTYSQVPGNLPVNRTGLLTEVIIKAITECNIFAGVDLSHPLIQENTAKGMTETFLEPINKIIRLI